MPSRTRTDSMPSGSARRLTEDHPRRGQNVQPPAILRAPVGHFEMLCQPSVCHRRIGAGHGQPFCQIEVTDRPQSPRLDARGEPAQGFC